jgi:D-alanyl-D-alanine carboxypeptidase/D-alanyl-D-alanine-endopeptidase (penicillin-binding protein 4)
MEQGLWGVEVKSLDSGRILYSRNPRTLMMPASNMKILTLAAARRRSAGTTASPRHSPRLPPSKTAG